MANPFIHVELATTDLDKAKAFYTGLFDWQLEEIPGMDYTLIKVGEGTGGGMMKHPVPDAPSRWLAYVMVDDAAATTEKARTLGATICKEVTEIPGIGWFSVITDPTGATLALWQMTQPCPKPAA
jgi:predicted enzyme related to lactoylglutathione lyase